MADPMTLEETIDVLPRLLSPHVSDSALHWLTRLKAENERLREELSTAPRDGWSAQREARVDALLKEPEPGDG